MVRRSLYEELETGKNNPIQEWVQTRHSELTAAFQDLRRRMRFARNSNVREALRAILVKVQDRPLIHLEAERLRREAQKEDRELS